MAAGNDKGANHEVKPQGTDGVLLHSFDAVDEAVQNFPRGQNIDVVESPTWRNVRIPSKDT